MGCLLLLLLPVLLLVLFTWTIVGVTGLLLTLFMAGLIGWAADAVVPGRLPGGWLGAILAGIAGAFIGTLLLGHVGPNILGLRVVPAFVGAVIIAAGAELLSNHSSARRYLDNP